MAVVLVFSGHFAVDFEASKTVSRWPLFYWGWTGVDLFFVLSGVLIGIQLWKELTKTGHIKIGTFLLRRGLRIWPLYFAFIALVLVDVLFTGRDASGLWADALFLSNYFHNQVGGSWSLSTEEQFYVLAPVGISIFALKVSMKWLWIFPILFLLIAVMSRGLTMFVSTLPQHDLKTLLYFSFPTHADGLALGLLLGWIVVCYPDLVRRAGLRILVSTIMLVLAALLYRINNILFAFTALALIYGAMVFYGFTSQPPKILRWHGFYVVSRLSYGIYLNHFVLLPRLSLLLGDWRAGGGEGLFWFCYVISFIACLGCSMVTFQLIEWPFLLLRSRWQEQSNHPRRAETEPGRSPSTAFGLPQSSISGQMQG